MIRWAIVDRFGNSSVGLGRCVSVHRTREMAERKLRRVNNAVRRGHGANAYIGWQVEPVAADVRKGMAARQSNGKST